MKSANASEVNAFPLYLVKICSDTTFKSGANSAPFVPCLNVLVPSDRECIKSWEVHMDTGGELSPFDHA